MPFEGNEEVSEQLKNCEVESTNDPDNYGSVYIFPAEQSPPANVLQRIPVEGVVDDSDDVPISLLLHVVEGRVSELEIFKQDGTQIKAAINPVLIKVSRND